MVIPRFNCSPYFWFYSTPVILHTDTRIFFLMQVWALSIAFLKPPVMYLCPYRVEFILLNIKSFLLTVYHRSYHPEVTVLQFTNLKKYQTTCSSPKYMLHYVIPLHILFSLFTLALEGYCSLIHQNPTHYIVQAMFITLSSLPSLYLLHWFIQQISVEGLLSARLHIQHQEYNDEFHSHNSSQQALNVS